MPAPGQGSPHRIGVEQRGVSEAAEADELARAYHTYVTQLLTQVGNHAKNVDQMMAIHLGNVVTQQHLSTLSYLGRTGIAGFAGMENVLGQEVAKTVAQRGQIREGDIGSAAREAITSSVGSLSLLNLPIIVERLREEVADLSAQVAALSNKA